MAWDNLHLSALPLSFCASVSSLACWTSVLKYQMRNLFIQLQKKVIERNTRMVTLEERSSRLDQLCHIIEEETEG